MNGPDVCYLCVGRDRETDIGTLRLDDKSECWGGGGGGGGVHVSFFFCPLLPLRRIQGKLGFCLMIISAETTI